MKVRKSLYERYQKSPFVFLATYSNPLSIYLYTFEKEFVTEYFFLFLRSKFCKISPGETPLLIIMNMDGQQNIVVVGSS